MARWWQRLRRLLIPRGRGPSGSAGFTAHRLPTDPPSVAPPDPPPPAPTPEPTPPGDGAPLTATRPGVRVHEDRLQDHPAPRHLTPSEALALVERGPQALRRRDDVGPAR